MALNESSTAAKKNCVSNCIILSSAFSQTPFVHSFLKPKIMVPKVSPNIITDIHDSITSAADKLSKFLQSIASQNPVLNKFLEFHGYCHQVRCRNSIKANPLSNHNFAAVLPGDSVAGLVVANGISNFLNLYNTLLVCRLVLTWFPNSPPAIVGPLSTLCDPYLNIFRGLIPPLGGTLDLSPILAFLVLNAFTSTAAALPCELPVSGPPPQTTTMFTHLTVSQKKWMRRLCGSREKSSN